MQPALAAAAAAPDASGLEAVRIKYLGRKGLLPELMQGLRTLSPEERPAAGQAVNAFKTSLHDRIESLKAAFEDAAASGPSDFDVTLPGQWRRRGTLHPVTQIIQRVTDILSTLGFTVADGPDLETPYYNFDALNTPANHPSRDPQDTFYLLDGRLLRTQTSPVQVRYMEAHPPPVRILAPGRCYRRDTTDATHSANFHQIEGLYIDRQVSMADLKSDLTFLAHELMGRDVSIRFRPHFFPFTEPSVEVDFSCHVCGGKGCRVCKDSGWIEIAGAGMVDPNVLKAVGYNPDEVSGYAFGMGIERIAMILYGLGDIRLLYENDVRFLNQF